MSEPMPPAQAADAAAPAPVPEGFRALKMFDDFVGANGPLYMRHERRPEGSLVQLGFRVERRHCNPMGICHGGMLATFCDMVLPLSMHRKAPEVAGRFLPTISLQLDYLSSAKLGAWVMGEAQVLRVTRSMVFGQGLVMADGEPAVRFSGVFKIGAPFTPPAQA